MDAKTLLARLGQTGPESPLAQLARLSLDHALDQKVISLLSAQTAAEVMREGLEGWLRSPQAPIALERLVGDVANVLGGDRRKLKELTPASLRASLQELAARPYSPDKRLVLTLIDRPRMRELIRGVLLTTILDFGRRASAPVTGVAKGLGSLVKAAAESARSRSGGLGSLVGAASDAVQNQLEKRAAEFVDAALAGVLGELADAVSDPKRATEAAELRTEALEGAFDLALPQLSRELINLDVPGGAKVLREGLERWVGTDAAFQSMLAAAKRLEDREGQRTLREVLEESGQLQLWRTRGVTMLEERMRSVVGAEAFSDWLTALMAE